MKPYRAVAFKCLNTKCFVIVHCSSSSKSNTFIHILKSENILSLYDTNSISTQIANVIIYYKEVL